MRWEWAATGCLLFIASAVAPLSSNAADKVAPKEAVGLLKKYCLACHGLDAEVPDFHVLDRALMTTRRSGDDKHLFLSPGKPDESYLWTRTGVHRDMPPTDRDVPQPSEAEREKLRLWIEQGAEFPAAPVRAYLSDAEIIRAIVTDLGRMKVADRPFVRYFSLVNLHNDPTVSEEDLRITRAGFVKFINSVSRSSNLVFPTTLDAPEGRKGEGTLFRLDLRDVNWTVDLWKSVVQLYPYGLIQKSSSIAGDLALMKTLQGTAFFDRVPYVRVDWFLTTASQGDAYHNLLGLPKTLAELEKQLAVDSKRDFSENRIKRSGFAGSAVSKNFRLVDRFPGGTKYFYRSYDFAKSHGKAVLVKFPLGPADLAGDKFKEFAFEEDGGELIWSLANGMQGYMIVDKTGKRIDEAPTNIVRDLGETGGTPAVVNGISCIGCHKHGMRTYVDRIKEWSSMNGEAQEKVDALFASKEASDNFLADDRRQFMAALERIMLPYVKDEDGFTLPIEAYPEPVSFVTRNYRRDLTLKEVAFELGFKAPENMPIRNSASIRSLGLLPIVDGGKIPRSTWETRADSPTSLFQQTALELDLGEPINPN